MFQETRRRRRDDYQQKTTIRKLCWPILSIKAFICANDGW
jgi:hypothetical protein